MTSNVMFSDKFLMSDVLATNLMLTGLFLSYFLSFQDENQFDSRFLSSCHQSLTRMCVWLSTAYASGEFGVTPPLSLIFYKNFITCAQEINCSRIVFAC